MTNKDREFFVALIYYALIAVLGAKWEVSKSAENFRKLTDKLVSRHRL